MEISNETAVKKPKRLTSVVWDHFERVRKADTCHAVCRHCNKKLSGSSNSGTTHLRNHLLRCLKRSNFDVSQLLSPRSRKKECPNSLATINFDDGKRKDDYVKPLAIIKFDHDQKKDDNISLGSSKFDQERSRQDLVRMIIMHGYPLAMVEHVGFKVFVKNLQPLFESIPNSSLELSCVEIYEIEKNNVNAMIKKLHGRLNLSVEMWCSPENAKYMCLKAYYIDEDWKFQKKILNFLTIDCSHTEDMVSEVIIKCLIDWDIDGKLFALTFDDCSTDDDIVPKIKDRISENRPRLNSSRLFDVRSAAHVIYSVVQDVLEAMRDMLLKIRESVTYIRSSQVTQQKFNEIAQEVGISNPKSLVLDCSTQWNSTFSMVETFLDYRAVFSLLQERDPAYTSALGNIEWEWVTSVSSYLKLFVEIMNVFSSNLCPTANIYFPEICDVHIQLIEWCRNPDDFLSYMAKKMKAKFDKYWSKFSFSLALAAILDPRFKMKLVEYYYSQIYGSTSLDRIKEVSDSIKELYDVYSICSTLIDQGSALPGTSLPSSGNYTRDKLKGFDKFLHETSHSQTIISDLDKYLEEPIFPRNCDFNILNWWKVHTPRYPILSMMARDVLGTPMSTVGPELAFATGGRVLDNSRSSLAPDTRQALICTQNWLRVDSEDLK